MNTELAPIAGFGQRNVSNMEFEIEVRVLDPIRMIESVGKLDYFLPIAGGKMEPAFDIGQDALERDPFTGRGGLVVDC